ncbi:MAG TPA: hypothetical protein VHX12_11965, partial [Acidisoma sp.]|nr:hypothetical protein [Acidisoma sp.]
VSLPLPGNCGVAERSRLWQSESASGTCYLLRFSGVHAAEFLVTPGGRRVDAAWTNPSIDRAHLLKLMLGPVLGLILRITRRLPLHAGAVVTDGRAVAVAGPSGSGKSTLIASLLDHGCTLLADDLIRVEEEGGVPVLGSGQAGLKLWPGSLEALDRNAGDFPPAFPHTTKRTVAAGVASSDATPLRAIFLLGPRRAAVPVSLDRLVAWEALTVLFGQLYPPFLPVNAEEHGALFIRLSWLVSHVPVYRVGQSDGFAALPALSRRIIEVAAASAGQ